MAHEENKEGKRGEANRQKKKMREGKREKRGKRRKRRERSDLESQKQNQAREEEFPQEKSVSGSSFFFLFSCFEILKQNAEFTLVV